jgi:hypothetical protein
MVARAWNLCGEFLSLRCCLVAGDSSAIRLSGNPTKRKAVVYVQEETCADDEIRRKSWGPR